MEKVFGDLVPTLCVATSFSIWRFAQFFQFSKSLNLLNFVMTYLAEMHYLTRFQLFRTLGWEFFPQRDYQACFDARFKYPLQLFKRNCQIHFNPDT